MLGIVAKDDDERTKLDHIISNKSNLTVSSTWTCQTSKYNSILILE